MPSQYLIDAYEQKKAEYLSHLTKDYSDEIDKIQNPQAKKIIPKDFEIEAYKLHLTGKTQQEIADYMGKTTRTIREYLKKVKDFQKTPLKSLEKQEN